MDIVSIGGNLVANVLAIFGQWSIGKGKTFTTKYVVPRLCENDSPMAFRLREALQEDLDKISDQIAGLSQAHIFAAKAHLDDAILKMRKLGITVELDNKGSLVKFNENKWGEITKSAIDSVQRAKSEAYLVFGNRDKTNVKPLQRLEALKIMLFCTTLENWNDFESQVLGWKKCIEYLYEDKFFQGLLKERLKSAKPVSKLFVDPIFQSIDNIIGCIEYTLSLLDTREGNLSRQLLDFIHQPEAYPQIVWKHRLNGMFKLDDYWIRFIDWHAVEKDMGGQALARINSKIITNRHISKDPKSTTLVSFEPLTGCFQAPSSIVDKDRKLRSVSMDPGNGRLYAISRQDQKSVRQFSKDGDNKYTGKSMSVALLEQIPRERTSSSGSRLVDFADLRSVSSFRAFEEEKLCVSECVYDGIGDKDTPWRTVFIGNVPFDLGMKDEDWWIEDVMLVDRVLQILITFKCANESLLPQRPRLKLVTLNHPYTNLRDEREMLIPEHFSLRCACLSQDGRITILASRLCETEKFKLSACLGIIESGENTVEQWLDLSNSGASSALISPRLYTQGNVISIFYKVMKHADK